MAIECDLPIIVVCDVILVVCGHLELPAHVVLKHFNITIVFLVHYLLLSCRVFKNRNIYWKSYKGVVFHIF